MHLYWLLQGHPDLLYRLMNHFGLTTAGQLTGFLDHLSDEDTILSQGEKALLRARFRTAASWLALRQQGLCRKTDRLALTSSGAVSSAFLDQVSSLAESLNGSGAALIEALGRRQVKGFRQNKTDQLASWLSGHGYLATKPETSQEERLQCILRSQENCLPPDEAASLVRFLERGCSLSGGHTLA